MQCEAQRTSIKERESFSVIVTEPDTIHAAISAFRAIDEEMNRLHAAPSSRKRSDDFEDESSRLGDLRDEALQKIYDTAPRTTAGLLALVHLFMDEDLPALGGIESSGAEAICKGVISLLTVSQA